MKTTLLISSTALLLAVSLFVGAEPPSRAEVEAEMGLASKGDRIRGMRDTVGFAVTASQAEDVVTTALRLEAEGLASQSHRLDMPEDESFIGGICPHDDHLYAARAYVHLTHRITAPRVVLIGVFHRARLWDLENTLVFDSFDNWHGPWA
ncbi:MAG: hypothetical protein GY906_15445, partial [bacterium]|nr:hypothetical protein [bacterium]